MTQHAFVVTALYKFVSLPDFTELQPKIRAKMEEHNVKGTLLLAHEGINGTITSTREGMDAFMAYLRSDARFADIVSKESFHDAMPFYRTKVRLKKEIVTMGVEDIDPNDIVGTYVKPKDWNALISDPDVLVIDTRNDYETHIGTFKGAVDPQTQSFREFPSYVKEKLSEEKHKKVAMFCTGGIRCEKSTAYLKQQGFNDVYHLEGGILKYLEEIPEEESLWEGECFVFDNRVAVKHGLEHGKYDQCFACRMPLTAEEMQHDHYEKGVSCHHCYESKTDEQRKRYADRQTQMDIAKEKGITHIGGDALKDAETRRQQKLEAIRQQQES